MNKRTHSLTPREKRASSQTDTGKRTATRQATFAVGDSIPASQLEHYVEDWLTDSQLRGHSPNTITGRRTFIRRLIQFLAANQYEECGTVELRAFFAEIGSDTAHLNAKRGGKSKPLRPASVVSYNGHIFTFFQWLCDVEVIDTSPMVGVPRPAAAITAMKKQKKHQFKNNSPEEIELLLQATKGKGARHPLRDQAMLLLIYDTGIRASECCTLVRGKLDLHQRQATVLGKGNVYRTVDFSLRTARALFAYLRGQYRDDEQAVFLTGKSGASNGQPLNRCTLLQCFKRWQKRAGLTNTRVGPHATRHSFAVEWLRNEGTEYTLQRILGHEDLQMTHNYAHVAAVDAKVEHRKSSPVDKLKMNWRDRDK